MRRGVPTLSVLALLALVTTSCSAAREQATATAGTLLDCSKGYAALRRAALAESNDGSGPGTTLWIRYSDRGVYQITQRDHPAHPAIFLIPAGEVSGCAFGDPVAFRDHLAGFELSEP